LCAAPESESAKTTLAESQGHIEKNVASLLTEAQTAAQEALKGEKKMNATKAEVSCTFLDIIMCFKLITVH
jgi:hypothetical protein